MDESSPETITLPPQYDSKQIATAINEAPPKAHWTGSAGFIIAMVAIVLIIAFLIIHLAFSGNCNGSSGGGGCTTTCSNKWTVNTTITSTNFSPGNWTLWKVAPTSATTITVSPPSSGTGSTFLVDNTAGTATITIAIKNSSTTLTVDAGKSAQLVWLSSNSLGYYAFV